MNNKLGFLLLLLLVFIFCSTTIAQITVEHAKVPMAPPDSKVMAAYMHLSNKSSKAVILIGANSPSFQSVEIHQSFTNKQGVAKMRTIKSLIIESTDCIQFKPGSYHFMLIKPLRSFKTGDTITIELRLQSGQTTKVNAIVVNPESMHQHIH